MQENLLVVKGVVAVIGSFVSTMIGGADALIVFLVVLICADIITGLLKAVANKDLDSRKMKKGAINKFLIFLIIVIAVSFDKTLYSVLGYQIALDGHEIYIRNLSIMYFCLEELLSVLENASVFIPLPKWLIAVLKQATDVANGGSTPEIIKVLVKKLFNIELKDTDKKEEKEENTDIDNDTE